eukprot:GHVS01034592.1.p1 GENE.GHVS01034592.1~~GHVS01034592.1.p1  ORF type:complete len:342 (+),score=21.98 GHVS01034592.1:223-1248(+)
MSPPPPYLFMISILTFLLLHLLTTCAVEQSHDCSLPWVKATKGANYIEVLWEWTAKEEKKKKTSFVDDKKKDKRATDVTKLGKLGLTAGSFMGFSTLYSNMRYNRKTDKDDKEFNVVITRKNTDVDVPMDILENLPEILTYTFDRFSVQHPEFATIASKRRIRIDPYFSYGNATMLMESFNDRESKSDDGHVWYFIQHYSGQQNQIKQAIQDSKRTFRVPIQTKVESTFGSVVTACSVKAKDATMKPLAGRVEAGKRNSKGLAYSYCVFAQAFIKNLKEFTFGDDSPVDLTITTSVTPQDRPGHDRRQHPPQHTPITFKKQVQMRTADFKATFCLEMIKVE